MCDFDEAELAEYLRYLEAARAKAGLAVRRSEPDRLARLVTSASSGALEA